MRRTVWQLLSGSIVNSVLSNPQLIIQGASILYSPISDGFNNVTGRCFIRCINSQNSHSCAIRQVNAAAYRTETGCMLNSTSAQLRACIRCFRGLLARPPAFQNFLPKRQQRFPDLSIGYFKAIHWKKCSC